MNLKLTKKAQKILPMNQQVSQYLNQSVLCFYLLYFSDPGAPLTEEDKVHGQSLSNRTRPPLGAFEALEIEGEMTKANQTKTRNIGTNVA